MGFLPKKISLLLLGNSKIPKIWKHRLKFCFEKSRPVFPDFRNFTYYQVKVGIFFWVKTPINGILCFILLWSHWFSVVCLKSVACHLQAGQLSTCEELDKNLVWLRRHMLLTDFTKAFIRGNIELGLGSTSFIRELYYDY